MVQVLGDCDPGAGSSKLCDIYVKLYINNVMVKQSKTVDNTAMYDAELTYRSGKINKSSKIKIELWDNDDPVKHSRVFDTEGNISSFILEPIRCTYRANIYNTTKFVETTTIWIDHLEEVEQLENWKK